MERASNLIYRFFLSNWFRWGIGILIIVDLLASLMFSFAEAKKYFYLAQSVTFFSAFIFTLEYILRIISAPEQYPKVKRYRSYFKYLVSFFGLIDLISILPFVLSIAYHGENTAAFDIARIFLVFKLLRHSNSFALIRDVFASVKNELLSSYVCIGILLCFCSVLMYYLEKDAQPKLFDNVGEGFWWALITFATVGYGDVYPITWLGKLLGMFSAVFGVMLFALPTAIVTSAFMNRLQSKERQEKKLKKKEDVPIFNESDKVSDTDIFCPHWGEKIKNNK